MGDSGVCCGVVRCPKSAWLQGILRGLQVLRGLRVRSGRESPPHKAGVTGFAAARLCV